MNLTVLMEYINLIILGICLCVGYMIKNVLPNDKINRFIPLIMGCLGMFLAIITNIDKLILEVILMGLLSGLASTGLYETFKNLIEMSDKNGN